MAVLLKGHCLLSFYVMKNKRTIHLIFGIMACFLTLAVITAITLRKTPSMALIEFDIEQDPDAILFSSFGEPPQFAIWLEDPDSGNYKTLFVTYRSATGDWVGKMECPVALPRWFDIYKKEFKKNRIPTPNSSLPQAVTGPTPKLDHFMIRTQVEPRKQYICWIEVNLAADFNAKYSGMDETTNIADVHFSGQPALLYRTRLDANHEHNVTPELYGVSSDDGQKILPVTDDIDSAKTIFKKIEIKVIHPKTKIIKEDPFPKSEIQQFSLSS